MPAKSKPRRRIASRTDDAKENSIALNYSRKYDVTMKIRKDRDECECLHYKSTEPEIPSNRIHREMKYPEFRISDSVLVPQSGTVSSNDETRQRKFKRWCFRINQHLTLISPPNSSMRRRSIIRKQPPILPTPPPAPSPPPMDAKAGNNLFPKPPDWFQSLITIQADILFYCLSSLISPFIFLFSLVFESYRQVEQTKESVESAAAKVPSTITHGSSVLLRKLGLGLLGVAYVCMVLFVVLVLASVIGVGFVQHWVEEPVLMKEKLHFDYTEINPQAVFSFRGGDFEGKLKLPTTKKLGMPGGHTFYVSLVMLMPESDYNRDMGVFQIAAELMSVEGKVIKSSSQPCMLRFRSLPIRLTRTLAMGVPLLFGFSSETQVLALEILRHKEDNPRSGAIRVTLIPRAGTSYLPQLYEAEIVVNSHLPWRKELIRSWKWTLYVWASLYTFVFLLLGLLCCCRSIVFPVFPVTRLNGSGTTEFSESAIEAPIEPIERAAESKDVDSRQISEAYRRWQRQRNKRKSVLTQGMFTDTSTFGSDASSISFSREDSPEEELGDSDSVCYGG